MAGHWVYIDIPSKTSRYTVFCEIADRPWFKNRTVRRYKPVSQSAIIVSELAVGALANRPRFKVLNHQRQTCSLVQKRISLRTVRSLSADHLQYTFQPKSEKQPLWYKSKISRRTVRAPWVDCPPFNFEAYQRDTLFGTIFEI